MSGPAPRDGTHVYLVRLADLSVRLAEGGSCPAGDVRVRVSRSGGTWLAQPELASAAVRGVGKLTLACEATPTEAAQLVGALVRVRLSQQAAAPRDARAAMREDRLMELGRGG